MLKAVIFDLDGTLTDCNLELAKREVARRMAALTKIPYDDVRKKVDYIHYTCNIKSIYDRNVWWDQIDPGLSEEEKQQLTNLYWNLVIKTTYIKPRVEPLLRALKKKGLTLVLLTDHDGKSFSKRERISLLPIVSLFDLVVIAGDDTKETKPSAQPYIHILETLELSPEEVLMVGDKPEVDLAGAHGLGIKTLLLEGEYGKEWEHTAKDLSGVLLHIIHETKV